METAFGGMDVSAISNAFKLEKVALRDKRLAAFRRNPTTWEILLSVSRNDLNIHQTIKGLETDCLGYSSIIRFITAQIAEGRLIAIDGQKRSEKIIKPGELVVHALEHLGELYKLGH